MRPACAALVSFSRTTKRRKLSGFLLDFLAIALPGALLYAALDKSDYYRAVADKADRSIMNVTFVTPSEDLNAAFVAGAKEAGLVNLKGHRATGGIRASIYNAMPLSGVEALAQVMKVFERKNG